MGAAEEDLLGDGRLLKRVLVAGHGPRPQLGRRVEVHYETQVAASGRKIDSSWDRKEPFDFVLGEGDVLEAWDRGVLTMRPGEKSEFTVDPSLAYGEEGAGDDIPGGTVLKFLIELLPGPLLPPAKEVEAKTRAADTDPSWEMAARLRGVETAKARGNTFMEEQKFPAALCAYQEALKLLEGFDGETFKQSEQLRALKLSCLLNLAQVALKLENYADAERFASDALTLEPGNCKALYRRGVARLCNGGLEGARADLKEACVLEPQNLQARAKLEECRYQLAQVEQWRKETYRGMFGKTPSQLVVARDLQHLPRVWLDIQIGQGREQRVKIILYSDTVPRTAENFRALCTGERGRGPSGHPLYFRRTLIHRVAARHLIEAGDITKYDGTGGESIYGSTFEDEGFQDAHHKRGLLSMVNRGPNTNDSRFFFTLRSLPQFDGKHVVFGEVAAGSHVLDAIEAVETEYPDWPTTQVMIVDSGEGW